MENFVKGFSNKYKFVPVQLYGKFSGHAKQAASPPAKNTRQNKMPNTGPSNIVPASTPDPSTSRPCLRIALKKGSDNEWSTISNSSKVAPNAQNAPNAGPKPAPVAKTTSNELASKVNSNNQSELSNGVASSVVDNVSSFLSGIRASFRQDNVLAQPEVRQKLKSLEKINHHGKQS